MFDELELLLREQKNDRVVYIPTPGNAGDSFIGHATYQLFERIGLQYELANTKTVCHDRVLILGGGGNLTSYYYQMAACLDRNAKVAKAIVLLPHTVRAHEQVLEKLGTNCFLFCREPSSFAFVEAFAKRANLYLSHDLAFGCDLEKTKDDAKQLRNYLQYLRHPRAYWRTHVAHRHTPVLNSFRCDVEQTNIAIPLDNIDLSHALMLGHFGPRDALNTTYRLIDFIERFDIVNTNRLHIAILAAMLGKQTHLFDNNYGKNRDVFFHSMKRRFANIVFH